VQASFHGGAGGLFGVLAESLGRRAATEDEVGVTQYVSPEVDSFSGIIKHRCAVVPVVDDDDAGRSELTRLHAQIHRFPRLRGRTRRRSRAPQRH
jgi:hypothetical protein